MKYLLLNIFQSMSTLSIPVLRRQTADFYANLFESRDIGIPILNKIINNSTSVPFITQSSSYPLIRSISDPFSITSLSESISKIDLKTS